MKPKDTLAIKEAIRFVCASAAIDDFEFRTRLGLGREALSRIGETLESFDSCDEIVELGINNSLNEVCFGLRIDDSLWNEHFTVSRGELRRVYQDWAALRGFDRTGIR